MTQVETPSHVAPREHSLAASVARVAALLSQPHYPGAERAALRRWAPGQPVPMAFYRLWLKHLATELPIESRTNDWMLIVWGLALAGGDTHQPTRALGEALAQSRYSEARLDRLLSAPEELRADLVTSLVRYLAAQGQRWNWVELAALLLTNTPDERESPRRRIAEAYYRYLPTGSE
jgi:CRISPR system Cascade subunit CasB